MSSPKTVKPQPTLKGYTAWAFEEILEILGMTPAECASHLISQWIIDNREMLADEYEISVARYREVARVLQHRREAKSQKKSYSTEAIDPEPATN